MALPFCQRDSAGDRVIKGPSLQHSLKVLRIWNCPACGRTVREPGAVTSRTCECSAGAQMTFGGQEPMPAPDVSEFVSYMTPEFQQDDDDGTDLPLPDLESLRPPEQESSGRRSRPGRPLRDTIGEQAPSPAQPPAEAAPTTDPSSDQAEADDTDGSGHDEGDTLEGNTATDSAPKKKRRRRRRRRRSGSDRRSEETAAGDASPAGSRGDADTESVSSDSEQTTSASQESSAEGSDTEGESSAPKRRRRRRRRRSRRKNDGGNDSSPPSSAGTEF